jgi:hypothetical protein
LQNAVIQLKIQIDELKKGTKWIEKIVKFWLKN